VARVAGPRAPAFIIDFRKEFMRPLTVLLGIVMGSTVSLAFCLLLVWIVFLLMPDKAQQFAPEQGALLKAVALFTVFSAASAASFYGELRSRPWRLPAHLGTLAMLGLTVALYWPR
jgi:hypothetical protein